MKEPVVEEMQRQVEHTNGVNGVDEKYDFNASAQPPSAMEALLSSPWQQLQSTSILGLFGHYWAAQGTMFWAIFVLGHDW
nr:omega-3 fatty acid desaturase, chloroplastic [Quercus suber]